MSLHPKTPLTQELGPRLEEERRKLKLTQGELADRLGVSRNSITQYEAGKHQPGAESLSGMHSLGMDILYVLTGQRSALKFSQLDMDRLALALKEARRQLGLQIDHVGQKEVLDRALIVYSALDQLFDVDRKLTLCAD